MLSGMIEVTLRLNLWIYIQLTVVCCAV